MLRRSAARPTKGASSADRAPKALCPDDACEVLAHLGRGLVALARVFGQQPVDQALEVHGDVDVVSGHELRDRVVEMGLHDLAGVVAGIRRRPGEDLEQDDAERVQVDLGVDRGALEDLGRHVARRAEDGALVDLVLGALDAGSAR